MIVSKYHINHGNYLFLHNLLLWTVCKRAAQAASTASHKLDNSPACWSTTVIAFNGTVACRH